MDWSRDSATPDDGRTRKLTQVQVLVDNYNRPDLAWTLKLRPTNVGASTPAADVPLASGTTTVGSAAADAGEAVFTLDPSLFPSGDYDLTLTATDGVGSTAATERVSLFTEAKVGNLVLPFTDLQVDVPGGQPITVTRVYDSANAGVFGEFGYGWRLETTATALRTTAGNVAGSHAGSKALRPGDLVYITLPGGAQRAFQFWPVPESYSGPGAGANPYQATYQGGSVGAWVAQFVSVDGSGATLSVPGDIHEEDSADWLKLGYDADANSRELFVNDAEANANGQFNHGYNPGELNVQYTVALPDGTTYQINAGTGKLASSTDASGNATAFSDDGITSGGVHVVMGRTGQMGTIWVRSRTSGSPTRPAP